MEQHNPKAHLDLVRALLNCPKGEEVTLLHQHEDLLTPELLQVMQEVAIALAREGHGSAARFLRHWEAQLAHSLTHKAPSQGNGERTEAYLHLMRALMDCPEGSEAALLKANQELVDEGFVQTLEQVATQAALQGDQVTSRYLHRWAEELDHGLQSPASSGTAAKASPDQPAISDQQGWLSDLEALLSQLHPSTPVPFAMEEPSWRVPTRESSMSPVSEEDHGSAIAKALYRLGSILKSRLHPHNPLWYMDILERAEALGWVLTTDEVEQLIGIKPRFPVGKHTFEWGCWSFEKVGRVGSQLSWRVQKIKRSSSTGETRSQEH